VTGPTEDNQSTLRQDKIYTFMLCVFNNLHYLQLLFCVVYIDCDRSLFILLMLDLDVLLLSVPPPTLRAIRITWDWVLFC
jgi:hypothetical protein